MKRRAILLSLLLLSATGAAGALAQPLAREGVVVASALNVRSGPSVRDRVVDVVYQGERLAILDEVRGWYRVATRAGRGWVSASYVQLIAGRPPIDPPGPRREFAYIAPNRFGYVNLFEGPGRDYPLKGELPVGERVLVIDPGPHWTLVAKRGVGRGYVRSRFLEY